ncbi:TapY2 family type IVa secretion system protein [Shewanella marisflavi]|uniref:TapY2 family type IVa secretion system protein n=1 Tax=Shewanella marisflavi TaxID=260364 RepID=UPI003AAF0ABE
MIKLLSTTICVISIALIAPTYAKMQEYKCFISSAKKGGQVVFYQWQESQLPLRMAGLPGKQLTDAKGNKYFIKEVKECVLLSESFTSDKAKAIDRRTLR